MNGSYLHRVSFTVICLGLLISYLTGCAGTTGHTPDVEPGQDTSGTSLLETIASVQSYPVPPDIEEDTYETLRAELVRVLISEAERCTATPPSGTGNRIDDLLLTGDDESGWTLQWCYTNVGDYDLNGMVSVSDLTPIGRYYEASSGDLNWIDAQHADGDSNGMITISDITPVGQNFESFISGFNIYGATSAESAWELVGSIPRPDPPASGPFLLTYNLTSRGHERYCVSPYDSGSLEGDQSWPCTCPAEPAAVTLGTGATAVTQSIGAGGGSLTASGGTPIDGTKLVLPAGALAQDTVVNLGWNDGSVSCPQATYVMPILTIDAGDVYEFEQPLQVTVPFTGAEDILPFACYIQPDGGLDGLQTVAIDYDADTFTFETFHASDYVIAYLPKSRSLMLGLNYFVDRDGFWVKNARTNFTNGNCMGMSVFSKWYAENVSQGQGNYLYHSYRDEILNPVETYVQQVIATRAQLSVHRYQREYAPAIIGRGYFAGHEYNYNAIVNMLDITRSPQVVILDAEDGQHVVTVYGAVLPPDQPTHVLLLIYDPNYPGVKKFLDYDTATKSFATYETGGMQFTRVIHFGTGTIRYAESFEDILVDANQDFMGNTNATIDITSHVYNAQVDTQTIDLIGTVHSGSALVEQLSITNGTNVVEASLGVNGEFNESILLHEGLNYLVFHCQGYNENNRLVTIHNNLLTGGFIINAEFPPALLTITSHSEGQTITQREILLEGTVTNSLEPIGRLVVTVGSSDEFETEVLSDGSFSLPVWLHWGENNLSFVTQTLADTRWHDVANSLGEDGLTLIGDFYRTEITIDTTWESELGLGFIAWVLIPGGDYSGDSHTADGWWWWWDLHQQRYSWYLSSENFGTIRWGEEYRFRLQFYHWTINDPPGEDVPYTVRVRINEGLPGEQNMVFTGVAPFEPYHHPQAYPEYWDPFCTLPGWTDVCTFTPIEP